MNTKQSDNLLKNKMNRRQMLKLTGAGTAGVLIGATGFGSVANSFGYSIVDDNMTATEKVPFYGSHQSGIVTNVQKHIYFASLNVIVTSKEELKDLFEMWTPLAVRMMNGEEIAEPTTNSYVAAQDTGEAVGLSASNLTITFGVGPTLFEKSKLGLGHLKPTELEALPHFPKDQLDESYSSGDLCIQACADDPQVAFHAVRNLIRSASGKVILKWTQAGFNSIPVEKNKKQTPRNLFAFKDGTGNPNVNDTKEMNDVVWVQSNESVPWMTGGTYLVARRIQMHLETWDRTALGEQEATFGRHRDSGAPIGKTGEFEDMELARKDSSGNPIIPTTSHVHLAKLVDDRILRRSFSYSSGMDPKTGVFDAGLLFISFQKHPKQFINIQNSLGRIDKLNEYITHRGSATFACFPGIQKGSFVGESLFKA
ncbi:iron uptake transporter deferrochelatase/peroxidase subunit [Psychrobacillus vulpis]|uniref:Deferrochelatase n=1 Tax=Psychrobacillus vulpis TaxID=2325572 RepID=A0A544TTG8_9BACI|nr:iron uptake transporter deferrochelatase/peroxidase subunit [Psychrobacillus vulpis]TQR20747.1 deferrochelatase/peroxidase EfeB [Psychrobacillus vulpis]